MKHLITALAVLMLSQHASGQTYSRKYNASENLIEWPERFDPKNSVFYVHNEIEINTPADVVWKLLTAASEWPTWYDGIQNIRFADTSQTRLAHHTKVFWNSMGQGLNNTVMEYEPERALAWQFDEPNIQGYHAWVIVPTASGCRVVTDESQTGKFARLQKIFIPKKLMKQHDNWLRLLKEQTENYDSALGYAPKHRLTANERSTLQAVLDESRIQLDNTVAGLSVQQLNYKPVSGGWSIAECIEHVTLAEQRFPQIVEEALLAPFDPDGRKKVKIADDAIRPRMTSRSWRARSPEVFRPSGRFESTEAMLHTFRSQRAATMEYVGTTTHDLRHHYWKHPLTGTIDLYQTLLLMSAHLERHIAQMEAVKAEAGFPAD
jgi:uncharacterized protein YndB with AHSA1/START domain